MNQLIKISGAVFLLLLSLRSQAQGPGYLGKHAYVKADFGGMLAFSNPNANNRGGRYYGEKGNQFGFNTNYDLRFGYAVSRRHAIFADLGYLKTGMIVDDITTRSRASIGYNDNHYLFYNLAGKSVALGCQWFNLRTGALAPMGNYLALSVKKTWINGDIIDKKTTFAYPNYSAAGHEPLDISPRESIYFFCTEIGQHFILSDRVIVSISAVGNFPVSKKMLNEYQYYDDPSVSENQRIYDQSVINRFTGHSIFLVKVGAGILLF